MVKAASQIRGGDGLGRLRLAVDSGAAVFGAVPATQVSNEEDKTEDLTVAFGG